MWKRHLFMPAAWAEEKGVLSLPRTIGVSKIGRVDVALPQMPVAGKRTSLVG